MHGMHGMPALGHQTPACLPQSAFHPVNQTFGQSSVGLWTDTVKITILLGLQLFFTQIVYSSEINMIMPVKVQDKCYCPSIQLVRDRPEQTRTLGYQD
ncbi:hypothetical protein V6N13_044760 [Hibiscus sabdariffa]